MRRLLRPYLLHCSLCCNCQWEAFGVTVLPAIECGTCIHQSLQFSLSSSLAEIRLGFFLLSGVLLGPPLPAYIPLRLFNGPLPTNEYMRCRHRNSRLSNYGREMRLIKCAYLFIIIFCKRSYKFHPSVSTHLGARAFIFGSTAKLERCSSFVLMFLEQELHWNENKKTIKIRNKLWCNRLKTFLR